MELLRADFAEVRRKASEFFDSQHGETYVERIRALLANEGQKRIVFDLGDLRKYDEGLVRNLLRNPVEVIPPFEEALRERARDEANNLDDDERKKAAKTIDDQLRMGFTGPFGFHRVTPRELLSTFLNTLVRVEGIVTKASLVSPKLQQSVHFCETTGKYTVRNYADVTSLTALPTGSAYPTKDDAGNPLTTEYGLCTFVNYQSLTIQEAPETAPPGQLPRSIDVLLEGDLVDKAKPGDRVSLVGIYRAAPQRATGQVTGVMRAVIIASHVDILSGEQAIALPTAAELRKMTEYVQELHRQDKSVLETVASSLAPSIKGHANVKKALLLQLVGGVGKTLDNGTTLRGDINVLLVGDPGVAKSQMLRAAMGVAPLAVSTTGRGSSGVGLTAAVTQDRETGERRLEAGAMVLADRGLVCIDEFDKMNDLDRVAIHEVMEQQTVTIAKAGIHTTLNARCSVLAAANPLYGSYDPLLTLPRNINLPDSLLSRFDLLFTLIDHHDPNMDKEIAEHVIKMHGLATANQSARGALDVRDQLALEESNRLAVDDGEEMDSVDKFYLSRTAKMAERGAKILKPSFIRKFVSYVRKMFNPTEFTEEAQNKVKEFYANLRSNHRDETGVPITARTLETIIRIATAHAKFRLDRRQITLADVQAAQEMIEAALLNEGKGAQEQGRKRGRPQPEASDSEDDEDGDLPEEEEEVMPAKKMRGARGGAAGPATQEKAKATPAKGKKGAKAAAAEAAPEAPASQDDLLLAGRPDETTAEKHARGDAVLRTLPAKQREILDRVLADMSAETQETAEIFSFHDFVQRVTAQGATLSPERIDTFLKAQELKDRVQFGDKDEAGNFDVFTI